MVKLVAATGAGEGLGEGAATGDGNRSPGLGDGTADAAARDGLGAATAGAELGAGVGLWPWQAVVRATSSRAAYAGDGRSRERIARRALAKTASRTVA
jgi:hypothetical protein